MFKTYDPGKVIVTFKGLVLLAPADGTFVSAERHEDTFTYAYGANGDMARVRSRKRGGRVVATLMGISPTNDQLSTILAIDESTGLGYGALQIVDINGTTLVHATNAWIARPANYEAASDHSPREWQFDCESLDMFIGGQVI
jgi:hypothetical protein